MSSFNERAEGSTVGWTCPECDAYNLRESMKCSSCGFDRDWDMPMDDELPEDSGPNEP